MRGARPFQEHRNRVKRSRPHRIAAALCAVLAAALALPAQPAPGTWRPAETAAVCQAPPIPAAMQGVCADLVAAQQAYDPDPPPPAPPPNGTALAAAAAALAPGAWADFDAGANFTAALFNSNCGTSLTFTRRGYYHAGAVWWLGQAHDYDCNNATQRLVRYDEAAHAWAVVDVAATGLPYTGHGYEHLAVCPSGEVYMRRGGAAQIWRRAPGGGWQLHAPIPGWLDPFGALECDGLGRLLYFDREDGARILDAGTWSHPLKMFQSQLHTQAVHLVGAGAGDVMLIGGGSGVTATWLVSGAQVTPVAAAPVAYGSNNAPAIVDDPTHPGAALLVTLAGAVHRFRTDTGAWSQVGTWPGAFAGRGAQGVLVAVHPYGVLLAIREGTTPTAQLYRPPDL